MLNSCRELGLAKLTDLRFSFFVPEALIPAAVEASRGEFAIGSQGVFRENVVPGANFGAFTTNLPAAAAANLGCSWSIIGHSEERRDKLGIIAAYQKEVLEDPALNQRAVSAVNGLINQEVLRALESGLNVLLCVGETAQERGKGALRSRNPHRTGPPHPTLRKPKGVEAFLDEREVVIGYEPIWAIGPGKTPPDGDYISFVAELIKKLVSEELGLKLKVVYGGGLKKENAAMLGSLSAVDGDWLPSPDLPVKLAFIPGN